MPDKITEAFSAIKNTGLFLDEQDFREQLKKSPKDVFGVMGKTNLFLDYDDFENSLGLKKKNLPYPLYQAESYHRSLLVVLVGWLLTLQKALKIERFLPKKDQ